MQLPLSHSCRATAYPKHLEESFIGIILINDNVSWVILLAARRSSTSTWLGLIKWCGIQVIAQMELWNERDSGRYENAVYVLPKHLDEKVAALHLPKLGAKLTKLTNDQASYINIPVEGPFKPAHYRY